MDNLTVFSDSARNLTADAKNGESLPLWTTYVEQLYICLTMLIGAPGNALILFVQFNNKDRSSTDILIAAMAVYELICSSILSVLRLLVSSRLWLLIASNFLCRLHFGLGYLTTFASSYLLAAIAVDRYIKTCWPLSNRFNVKTSKIICVFVFFAGCFASGSVWISVIVNERFECVVSLEYIYLQFPWDMVLISSTAFVFIIFIFTYVNIAITLRKRICFRKTTKVWPTKVRANACVRSKSQATTVSSEWQHRTQTSTMTLVDLESEDTDRAQSSGATLAFQRSECYRKSKVDENKPSHYPPSTSKQLQAGYRQNIPKLTADSQTESAEKTANRITLIMFLLALIYALTYTTVNACVATNGAMGPVMEKFCKSILVVNCISNPVLLFCMSSRYRTVAKTLIFRRRR